MGEALGELLRCEQGFERCGFQSNRSNDLPGQQQTGFGLGLGRLGGLRGSLWRRARRRAQGVGEGAGCRGQGALGRRGEGRGARGAPLLGASGRGRGGECRGQGAFVCGGGERAHLLHVQCYRSLSSPLSRRCQAQGHAGYH